MILYLCGLSIFAQNNIVTTPHDNSREDLAFYYFMKDVSNEKASSIVNDFLIKDSETALLYQKLSEDFLKKQDTIRYIILSSKLVESGFNFPRKKPLIYFLASNRHDLINPKSLKKLVENTKWNKEETELLIDLFFKKNKFIDQQNHENIIILYQNLEISSKNITKIIEKLKSYKISREDINLNTIKGRKYRTLVTVLFNKKLNKDNLQNLLKILDTNYLPNVVVMSSSNFKKISSYKNRHDYLGRTARRILYSYDGNSENLDFLLDLTLNINATNKKKNDYLRTLNYGFNKISDSNFLKYTSLFLKEPYLSNKAQELLYRPQIYNISPVLDSEYIQNVINKLPLDNKNLENITLTKLSSSINNEKSANIILEYIKKNNLEKKEAIKKNLRAKGYFDESLDKIISSIIEENKELIDIQKTHTGLKTLNWYNFNRPILSHEQIDRILNASDFIQNTQVYFILLENQKLTQNQLDFLFQIIEDGNLKVASFFYNTFKNNKLNEINTHKFLKLYSKENLRKLYDAVDDRDANLLPNYRTHYSVFFEGLDPKVLQPFILNEYFASIYETTPFYNIGDNAQIYRQLLYHSLIYQYSTHDENLLQITRISNKDKNDVKLYLKNLDLKNNKQISKNLLLNLINYLSDNRDLLDKKNFIYYSDISKLIIEETSWEYNDIGFLEKLTELMSYGGNSEITKSKIKTLKEINYKNQKIIDWALPFIITFLLFSLVVITFSIVIYIKGNSFSLENTIMDWKFEVGKVNIMARTPIIGFIKLIRPFRNKILNQNKPYLLRELNINLGKNIYDKLNVNDKNIVTNKIYETLNSQMDFKMILGDSGTGKTVLLSNYILNSDKHIIYLKANEIDEKIINTISKRVDGLLKDTKFITWCLKKGEIQLCIDGLNEINIIKQSKIIEEIKDSKFSDIIISSQKTRAISKDKFYLELKGIHEDNLKDFLNKYERSENYQNNLETFLKNNQKDNKSHLTNTMDLFVISELLNRNIEVDLYNIYSQQVNAAIMNYQENNNGKFPLDQITSQAYKLKSEGLSRIDSTGIEEALESLLEYKVVNKRELEKSKNWNFRHDKIEDYFVCEHFSKNKKLIFNHLGDIEFIGVYAYIAKKPTEFDIKKINAALYAKADEMQDWTIHSSFWNKLNQNRDT